MNESYNLTQEKNLFIEQMRGIAVLLVLVYHFTNRIPAMYMGSDTPPDLEFFTGKIGVYVFFVISGYLIAKTIRNSQTLGEFYAKRLSRIWPLFLLANTFIFIWLQFFETPVVPEGLKDFDVNGRTVWDYIGTSFFLEDLGFHWLDGVFWSILVELKYYLFVGIFALLFKNRYIEAFSWFAIILAVVDFLIFITHGENYYTPYNRILHGVFISQYLPFFAMGMLLFHRRINLVFGICMTLASAQFIYAASLNPDFEVLGTVKFLTVFALFLIFDRLACKGQLTRLAGEYSYSIYLFHQVVGLSVIMMLIPYVGINAAIVIAFAFIIAVSVLGSKLVEWRFRRTLTGLMIKAFGYIGLDGKRAALDLKDEYDATSPATKTIPAKGV